MNAYRINSNYAKALFLLATDLHQTDDVFADMQLLADVCSHNRLLLKVFANPVIPEAKKSAIVSDLFASRVTPTTLAFLLFVVRKRRAVNFKGIADAFIDLYRDSKGLVVAHLATVQPPQPDVVEAVRRLVSDFTHRQTLVDTHLNPNILGSFVLAFDTYLYDASVASRLDRLRSLFAINSYESKL